MLIVDNGGGITPEPTPTVPAPTVPVLTPEPTPDIIVVDGKEYDTSNLTDIQKEALRVYGALYENTSRNYKDTTSFEVYIYNITQIPIHKRILETQIDIDPEQKPFFEEMLDTDFESPSFQAELWYYNLRKSMEKYKILVPIGIGIGVLITGLVGYQYSKSYLSEKGKVKARG